MKFQTLTMDNWFHIPYHKFKFNFRDKKRPQYLTSELNKQCRLNREDAIAIRKLWKEYYKNRYEFKLRRTILGVESNEIQDKQRLH